MTSQFTAIELSATEEDWGLLTVLSAPSTEEEDFYLMLQRGAEYDEQDAQLGMDKPYIEFCGQGWSWYGHMQAVELFRDRVQVQMDEVAAAEMNTDGFIQVDFSLDDALFEKLRGAFLRTFDGCSFFTAHC